MTVFADPLALTIFDTEHGAEEDRWVTLGLSQPGKLLLVIHTHVEMTTDEVLDHLRPPTDAEGVPVLRTRGRAMKTEYDFSKGERGKFFRKDAVLVPPVHLEPEVLSYLSARAAARGTSLSALVNDLLKKGIELIEVAK